MLAKIYDLLIILLVVLGLAVLVYLFINRDWFFKKITGETSVVPEQMQSLEPKIASKWLNSSQSIRGKQLFVKEDLTRPIVFAAGLNTLQKMFVVDKLVVVTEADTGNIVVLNDIDGDNSSDNEYIFDTSLDHPYGLYYYSDNLYVVTESSLLVYEKFLDQYASKRSEYKTLVSNLPFSGLNNLKELFIKNNTIYVSIGTKCDICIEPDKRRGSVVSYNLDGTNEKIYVSGLRNVVGITDYNNQIIFAEQSILSFNTNDEINIGFQSSFYGWPYIYNANNRSPDLSFVPDDLISRYSEPYLLLDAGVTITGIGTYKNNLAYTFTSTESTGLTLVQDKKNNVIVLNGNVSVSTISFSDIVEYENGLLLADSANGIIYFIR